MQRTIQNTKSQTHSICWDFKWLPIKFQLPQTAQMSLTQNDTTIPCMPAFSSTPAWFSSSAPPCICAVPAHPQLHLSCPMPTKEPEPAGLPSCHAAPASASHGLSLTPAHQQNSLWPGLAGPALFLLPLLPDSSLYGMSPLHSV